MVTASVRSCRGLRKWQSNLTARLKSPEDEAGICQTRPHSFTTTIRVGLSYFGSHDTRRRQAKLASTTTHTLIPAILHDCPGAERSTELATANFREFAFYEVG